MISAMGGSSGYMAQMQMQGMQQGQNQGGRFNKLDADQNGGIDQTELQALTDQLSTKTGQQIDVEETTKTYDSNGDGLLTQDEMQPMMMDLREKMGGSQGGGGGQNRMQALTAYQANAEQDTSSMLMDILGGQEDDQEGYTPITTQA